MSDRPMGLYRDMPAEEYHAVDALSATGMKHLARSAWHYKNRIEVEETKSMLRGNLVHCALLEAHALHDRYVVVPEDAPRRPTKAQWEAKKSSPESIAAKEWWTDFAICAEGKQIISADDFSLTQQQLIAIQSNAIFAELFSKGYGECSVFWIDPQTGIYCKARPDWVHPLNDKQIKLIDLKSTADESPSGFGRAAARMGYHRQAAHYRDGFQQATGLEVVDFVFAAVSAQPPVLAVPYVMLDDIDKQAVDECAELRALYAECVKSNRWSAYGDGYMALDFPAYAKRDTDVEITTNE